MNLFGGKPKPEPVVRMPVPDDKDALAAAERQRRAIAGRTGRRATMLSRPTGGEAGTAAFKNSLLGQAG